MAPRIRSLPAIQRTLLEWHGENGLRAPWRESGDPYHCLVAAVMAQQTQMSRVMPSYELFVAAYPTLESLADSTLGAVIRVWGGMGYNQRAVRLHRAARQIADGGWPHDAASLQRIDGIGPFTAAIIASFSFGETAACVDTNVRRVLSRLAGDDGIDGAALQRLADDSVPAGSAARWNQVLMDYGARVCASRPKCGECVIARWCASRERFAGPLPRVAETRVRYRAKATAPNGPRETYEGSDRYYRGRIIALLRGLPPGETLAMRRLPRLLANGAAAPSSAAVRVLADALARQGLAVVYRGRISLPD